MSPKVIKKLQQDAVSIYYNFIKPSQLESKNWSSGSWAQKDLNKFETEVNRTGVTLYLPNSNRKEYFKFTNLRPNQPENVVYHPINKTNIKNDGLYTIKTINQSANPVIRRFVLGASSETSQGQAVGVGVSATISASVTVGSAAINGFEVGAGFSATVSADYNKQWGSSETKTESRELTVDVAPRSIMYIDLTKATADCSQLTECFTTFDYGLEINLQTKKFKDMKNLNFISVDDMVLYALGYGDEADANNGWFAKYLRQTKSARKFSAIGGGIVPSPEKSVDKLRNQLKANAINYAYSNKFKGASTGEVKVRETDLNSKGFKYNG